MNNLYQKIALSFGVLFGAPWALASEKPIIAVVLGRESVQIDPLGTTFTPWSAAEYQAQAVQEKSNATYSPTSTAVFQISAKGNNDARASGVGPRPGAITVHLESVDLPAMPAAGNGLLDDRPKLEFVCRSNEKQPKLFDQAVVAEPGGTLNPSNGYGPALGLNTGTNHRLLISFSGLRPNARFAFRFFACDPLKPQGVYVFTNVTDAPTKPLNPANAADDNNLSTVMPPTVTLFNPGNGDHRDGTQYAPDGAYVWTDGAPSGREDRDSVTVEATSDATGNICFAETTVVNLYGIYQPFPVLNAFEILSLNGK
jgi:hypothetical protein